MNNRTRPAGPTWLITCLDCLRAQDGHRDTAYLVNDTVNGGGRVAWRPETTVWRTAYTGRFSGHTGLTPGLPIERGLPDGRLGLIRPVRAVTRGPEEAVHVDQTRERVVNDCRTGIVTLTGWGFRGGQFGQVKT